LLHVSSSSSSSWIDDLDSVHRSAQRSAQLSVVGSPSVLPFAKTCAEEFNSFRDDPPVSVTGSGTGVGIKSPVSGIVEIAMASREVRAEEAEIYDE
jgi:phosphate transport system substrate-binding protein